MAGKVLRKEVLSCHSNEVYTVEDTVQVNYFCWVIGIRLYDPHPGVLTRSIINLREPLDQGTRVCSSVMFECKETKDSGCMQPPETLLSLVMLNKYTVITGRTFMP